MLFQYDLLIQYFSDVNQNPAEMVGIAWELQNTTSAFAKTVILEKTVRVTF